MRKQLKKKKHSCPFCKPHKMGKCNRWKSKEKEQMFRDYKEIRNEIQSHSVE